MAIEAVGLVAVAENAVAGVIESIYVRHAVAFAVDEYFCAVFINAGCLPFADKPEMRRIFRYHAVVEENALAILAEPVA